MPNYRGCRISLIIHDFFQEQRVKRCYVLIKSEFNIIQDLMNHITHLFNIENFTLLINDCYLSPNEDISIIQSGDFVVVKPNYNIPQNQPPTQPTVVSEVTEGTAKEKKKKNKRKSLDPVRFHLENDAEGNDEHNLNLLKAKKRKLSNFEPTATSSTKKSEIVETRVQYYNNLSNHSNDSNEGASCSTDQNNAPAEISDENLKQIKENKEVVQHKLEKKFSADELITPAPVLTRKSSKKKLITSNQDDLSASNEHMDCGDANNMNIHLENTEKQDILNNIKNANEKTPLATNNEINLNSKLIQHITPSRDIQPNTLIKKKINVIHNIIVTKDNTNLLMQDSKNSLIDATKEKPKDLEEQQETPIMLQRKIHDASTKSTNQTNDSVASSSSSINTADLISVTNPVIKLLASSTIQKTPLNKSDDVQKTPLNKCDGVQITPNDSQQLKSSKTPGKSLGKRAVSSVSHLIQTYSSKSVLNVICDESPKPLENQTPTLQVEEQPENTQEENCENHSLDSDSVFDAAKNVTRRKRTRTRQRKRNIVPEFKVHQDTPMPHRIQEYRKPNVEAKPLIHKFFNDEEVMTEERQEIPKIIINGDHGELVNGEMNKVNNSLIDLTENTPVLEKDIKEVESSYNNSKSFKESDQNCNQNEFQTKNILPSEKVNGGNLLENDANCPQTEETDDKQLKFIGKSLSQDKIEKLLIMDEMLPNFGDNIVFQKLKLSDDFTPILSKYIIGTVVGFDATRKKVEFHILEGLCEFKTPNGMLNPSEDEMQPEILQILDWNSLIKPRLLSI